MPIPALVAIVAPKVLNSIEGKGKRWFKALGGILPLLHGKSPSRKYPKLFYSYQNFPPGGRFLKENNQYVTLAEAQKICDKIQNSQRQKEWKEYFYNNKLSRNTPKPEFLYWNGKRFDIEHASQIKMSLPEKFDPSTNSEKKDTGVEKVASGIATTGIVKLAIPILGFLLFRK